MNDRIKELINEARQKTSPHDDEQFNKTLVELIVQECINVLNRPEFIMKKKVKFSQYNEGWVNGRILGIEQIQEHFRVK
jgi:hypothetical protein